MNDKRLKKLKCYITIIFFVSLMLLPLIHIEKVDAQNTKLAIFKPLYQGYSKGTFSIPINTNTSLISREWNFEGWNLTTYWNSYLGLNESSLTMEIIYCEPIIWFFPESKGIYYSPKVRVYLSNNDGLTFIQLVEFPRYSLIMDKFWDSGTFLYSIAPYTFSFSNASLFNPRTKLKLYFYDFYVFPVTTLYFGNYYYGSIQKPVPPYDYIDGDSNYVQYAIRFTVEYVENIIPYYGKRIEFPYETTKEKLLSSANMILNTTHPSGASNEVIGKAFGTDSWIIIYSSQLAMKELINLLKVFPDNNYLLTVKRFITYMWSKQNLTDGSFPFILTDGDSHPWYNATANLYYGYDKIDSFSALAITLMREYYNASNDLDFLNENWSNIYFSKEFVVSLMNLTYWLPVDGFHYNGTHYIKSEMNWLHDCVEAYQGIKDYALIEGIRGNTTEQTYWNNYADSIANGIRTYFWNESLNRYSGMFFLTNATQNTAKVYNIITPLIYGIETNITRAISTLTQYIDWGLLSGRYYDNQWAEDYSIYNEYSTMSGMIYSAFAKLQTQFNYSATWVKDSFFEVSKFLFNNPIYPNGNLQNPNGFLDYVNLIEYTYANDYARLIESSAWFINGFIQIPNMTELFTYSAIQLQELNQTIIIETEYWNLQKSEFENEMGKSWNTSTNINLWKNWLKNKQLYVQWWNYEFRKFLFDKGYFGDLWWENEWKEEWDNWIDIYITNISNINFYIGLIGIGLFCANPVLSYKLANGDKFKFMWLLVGIGIVSIGLTLTFIYSGI